MSAPEFIKGSCAACAGHLEFPAAGAGTTIHCPHCGQPTELTAPAKKSAGGKTIFLTATLAVIIVSAIVAARLMLAKNPAAVAPAPNAIAAAAKTVPAPLPDAVSTNDFAIATFTLEKKPGSSLVYVTGQLRNLTARQRFGVRLEFALFGAKENQLGTAKDYVPVIEPHGLWTFKALVLESQAVSAQFHSLREDQ